MDKEKGFTVIELILSFLFVMALATAMFGIVMNYRDKAISARMQGDLETFRVSLLGSIQNDINSRILKKIEICHSSLDKKCFLFSFNDGATKKLEIQSYTQKVDDQEFTYDIFIYDDIKYIPPSAYFSKIDLVEGNDNISSPKVLDRGHKKIYKIDYPLYHDDLPGQNYGIKIITVGFEG